MILTQVTPEPSPTPVVVIPGDETTIVDKLFSISTQGVIVIALAVLLIMAAATLIAWAVLRSAQLPPPTALITSLSLLSLFAIAGGIATNNDAAWTIGAAGVGALASSVSNIFQQGRYTPEQVEKAVAVVQEIERQEEPRYEDPRYEDSGP